MLPPACLFHTLPLSHVRTCPVEDSLLLLVPLAHAMPCQPRCPWLTPSVSSSWAEPSAYCYRSDIFFVHPYRPRLCFQLNRNFILSALRLSPFMCSHLPLNLGASLCDIGIVICIEVRAVVLLCVQGCRCKLASNNLCFINE